MWTDTGQGEGIFLYEDDDALAAEIVTACAAEGLVVEQVHAESELVDRACGGGASILIMDRMVGAVDSLTIVARLRAAGGKVPVLVISSMVSVDDRIHGLKVGGDDYLVKPFAMGELIARIEALRRRAGADARQTSLTVGSLAMDLIDRTVTRGERVVVLLPREFGLLEYLMRHAGDVVTRSMLLEDVWHYRTPIQTNVVDVHVGNLRRKIDADGEPKMIESVRGVGFRLVDATS